jgi:hypothetical protein
MVEGWVGSGFAVAVFSRDWSGDFGNFEQAVWASPKASAVDANAIQYFRPVMNNPFFDG